MEGCHEEKAYCCLKDDVIMVCPRGGGGAKKSVDFDKSKGVDEKRLIILEKGMDAWPYETEKK